MAIKDWLQGTNNQAADGYNNKPGKFRIKSETEFKRGLSKTAWRKNIGPATKFKDETVKADETYKRVSKLIKKRGYLSKETLNKDLQKMGVKDLDRKRYEKALAKHFGAPTIDPEAAKREARMQARNIAGTIYSRSKDESEKIKSRRSNVVNKVLADEETGYKQNTLGIESIEKATSVLQAGQEHAPTMFAKKVQKADDYQAESHPASIGQVGSSKVIGKPGQTPSQSGRPNPVVNKPGGPPPSTDFKKGGGIKLAA